MFIIKYKKIFVSISIALVVLSIGAIAYFGLNMGIDFKGGSLTEVEYKNARPDQKTIEEEIRIVFPGYEKYISREFEDKALAFEDKDVISTKCYICHKNLRRKIRWFSPNGKHYYSVAYCDVHGYVKGKIRLRRSENNKVYVVKTMKITDLEEVEKIRDRQDKMRIHRRIKKHK